MALPLNRASSRRRKSLAGFDIIDPYLLRFNCRRRRSAVFSAMLMRGVARNAVRMVDEIHRQFDEIEGLKEGREGVAPEYDKCISIATDGALKELIPAGLFAIVATLVVGFVGGVSAIGGFLTGNIVSGLLLSLFMSNAGGLWDNAKNTLRRVTAAVKALRPIKRQLSAIQSVIPSKIRRNLPSIRRLPWCPCSPP